MKGWTEQALLLTMISAAAKHYFFGAGVPGAEGKVQCKRCPSKIKKGSGNSWMKQHLTTKTHAETWEEEVKAYVLMQQMAPEVNVDTFVNRNAPADTIHKWLGYVVDTNQPVTCVSNPSLRPYVKMESICYNTFMKYSVAVSVAMRAKIAAELPDKFGLLFDGKHVTKSVMLGCSHLPVAGNQNAANHDLHIQVIENNCPPTVLVLIRLLSSL